MPSFLLSYGKKYKGSLLSVSGIGITILGVIWTYDFQQLTLSGTLTHREKLEIRIVLTLISISLYLLSLLVLTLIHYKKDLEPITITPEERERMLKALNSDKSEITLLKKELAIHKKYLKQYAPTDFDIGRAEEYEKGWNEAGKHLKE